MRVHADICAHATAAGVTEERGIAETVFRNTVHENDPEADMHMERFIASFRKTALEIVASSVS